ncbi:MAG TPA: FAD:protein FMN transferase [Actinocrinis sp.]|nr:FAD:protein FMN transferase [Actinocrinis sp.]
MTAQPPDFAAARGAAAVSPTSVPTFEYPPTQYAEQLHHAEPVMGTVFSFAISDAGRGARREAIISGLRAAVARLHRIDEVFSTYRDDSDISRLGRGELVIEHCDPGVAEVLQRCREVAAETDGWFTAHPAGRLDPSGWVKGWAIEQASRLLREAGSEHHCVSGGGDVQAVGEARPGRPWRIGIADPVHRDRIIAAITTRDAAMAVATSGIAERGAHIVNPHTGQPAAGLLSMTLVGSSIARTDAWATAAFAMGPTLGLQWAGKRAGIEALAVLHDGTVRHTPGITELIA